VVERAPEEPPPIVVLVHGPPGVGKSTLIKCLINHYTRQSISEVKGPITVVSGKSRRLTFIECPQVGPFFPPSRLVELFSVQSSVCLALQAIRCVGCRMAQELNGMIDAAKYADLVLLLVDAAFGFEMETFEFLNILQVAPGNPQAPATRRCCCVDQFAACFASLASGVRSVVLTS
jgi:ribosome biogenesis protein BMS1